MAGRAAAAFLADGARHGRGLVLLSRTRFDRVLSSLRLPISGAVVLWGLQIVPSVIRGERHVRGSEKGHGEDIRIPLDALCLLG